jgi:hypothetical protein
LRSRKRTNALDRLRYLHARPGTRRPLPLASITRKVCGVTVNRKGPVLSWTASESGGGVSVVTEKDTDQAKSLVISVGPWANEFVRSLLVPLAVSRRVMFWLNPTTEHSAFDKRVFPIFIWEPEQGPLFYGFPRTNEPSDPKVAIHSGAEACTPSTIDRSINSRDFSGNQICNQIQNSCANMVRFLTPSPACTQCSPGRDATNSILVKQSVA